MYIYSYPTYILLTYIEIEFIFAVRNISSRDRNGQRKFRYNERSGNVFLTELKYERYDTRPGLLRKVS